MDPVYLGVLTVIGLVGGFMAGFLGISGGVVMIPLLLYGAQLPMKLATGISMAQAFAATISGVVIHRQNRTVDARLGIVLGLAGMLGALLGSLASAALDGRTLLAVYVLLVVVSIALLLRPTLEQGKDRSPDLRRALPVGLGVGILAGMLGVGGGFILIPLMTSFLRVPIRVAVGTSLLSVLLITLSGLTGKVATGLFDLQIAAFVVLGSIVGAQAGGRVNARVSGRVIRAALILLMVCILLRSGFDLLAG